LLRSMTAYGRGEVRLGDTLFVAEIKSVNHRYRDVFFRIPKNYQVLEDELRSLVYSKIRRGRLEISVQVEESPEKNAYHLELNVPLVRSYLSIFDQLAEQLGMDRKIPLESFCQMKDVILFNPPEVDVERMKPGFQEVIRQALDSLDLMRIREGDAVKADFLKRIGLIETYIRDMTERTPDLLVQYRKRLLESVRRIQQDVIVDETRLAQEVAFLAEKSDITEETVRIGSHLEQFREVLGMEDAVGRRLDFLIQEINREVNTLSAKASDAQVSRIVVEIKAELEKLREQVQNVE